MAVLGRKTALEVIAETVIRYTAAEVEAGADSFFVATQTGSPDVMTRETTPLFYEATLK